ncbi:MAG: phosphatase PAP2 family protein [Alistipes sp.]|jgi:undecaprenyl-diphosphatase|nr:phosphatase PAP2 family protein [Alistipes sp.]
MYTFDHGLFLWLNFDGGAFMDWLMTTISGTAMWIPLYLLIFWLVWRKEGWKGVVTFIICLALAMGLSDMICGIFKHTGLLKNVWESFPVRHRPMFDAAVRDLAHVVSYRHGAYGTVSAHAATTCALAVISSLVIRRKWFAWMIAIAVLLICYSRIYLACHFPMDILLGLVVGAVTGVAMWFLWRKLTETLRKFGKSAA